MIQEIINFVKDLEADYPEVFDLNKKPSPGLHFWVELDEEGNWKNNQPKEGVDYVVYDGKEDLTEIHILASKYEDLGRRLGNNMNKVLDKKKQIFSCSPFVVSFKLKSYTNDKLEGVAEQKIINLLDFYFNNSQGVCIDNENEEIIEKSNSFKQILPEILNFIKTLKKKNEDSKEEELKVLESLKEDFYLNFYLRNVSLTEYELAQENYLQQKLFNVNDFNSDKEITSETWGVSDFINGTGAKFTKKTFLQHKTGSFHKGIAGRIQAKDSLYLNKFDLLQNNRVLPNPLPLFIDKNEFKNNKEIVSVFNNEGERNFTYPQLLNAIYNKNENRILGNYYLLNMSRGVVNDFDFVSNFQYKIGGFDIKNILQFSRKNELVKTIPIHSIFGFENTIVAKIFNNSLVKVKDDKISYNYFNDIDPNYVSGGELMANTIMRFRKAFYDYIYKSQRQAVTSTMFDEIMLISILCDLRNDEVKQIEKVDERTGEKKKFHTKEKDIKEKLNIWFSLYNRFSNQSKNREDMANTFKTLLERAEKVANNDKELLDENNVGEFLFAAGQVIYFLLSKSKTSNPTHALLEPFLQKSNAVQLQNAIANSINMYKHEISFYKDRFERLAGQVLAFDTSENLKNYQRYLLAGYFAPAVIYKKSDQEELTQVSNN